MLPYTLKDRLRESLIWVTLKYSPMYISNLIKSPTFLFVHSGTSQEKIRRPPWKKNELFDMKVAYILFMKMYTALTFDSFVL